MTPTDNSNAQWKNAVALVTGASSGIGEAIAESLVAKGLRVVAAARRTERLDALGTRLGPALFPLKLDLREPASVQELHQRIRNEWGGVDVLVNNAGLGYDASLIDGDPQQWREMLDVNIMGLLLCTQEALQDMKASGRGHIVHISSMSGHRIVGGGGVYAATKFAVRALTESLRQELRAKDLPIRVCSISPGFVETEFAEKYHRSKTSASELYTSIKVLAPQDIAKAVCFSLEQPPHVEIHDILLRPTQQVP
jgi:NADP-dependent 3-hydroxy acid dehydrogenase YdfG